MKIILEVVGESGGTNRREKSRTLEKCKSVRNRRNISLQSCGTNAEDYEDCYYTAGPQ